MTLKSSFKPKAKHLDPDVTGRKRTRKPWGKAEK